MRIRIENNLVVETLTYGPHGFDSEGVAYTEQYWYDLGWRNINSIPPILNPSMERYGDILYNPDTDTGYYTVVKTVVPEYNKELEYLGQKYYDKENGVDTYYILQYTQEELDRMAAQKMANEAQVRKTLYTLTKFEFLSRFTMDEKRTIYSLESTNVDIRIWLETFRVADEIWLEDPETVVGIQALEDATILAPGRAAEILTSKTEQL